jgi:hypothetical protein
MFELLGLTVLSALVECPRECLEQRQDRLGADTVSQHQHSLDPPASRGSGSAKATAAMWDGAASQEVVDFEGQLLACRVARCGAIA